MFEVPIGRAVGHAIDELANRRDIAGMRSLEDQVEGRRDRSVAVEDAKRLVRPDEFPIGNIPAKTAGLTESLRFRQIGLPGEERLVQIPKGRGRLIENVAKVR